ncbi:MAG: hypothetical protein ACE5DI_01985 [Candidatus Micrarchaeia archaeon]
MSRKSRAIQKQKTVSSASSKKQKKNKPAPCEEEPKIDETVVPHIYSFAEEVGGQPAVNVMDCVINGATDEIIGEKTTLKIAEVRSILNHLHSFGIVEYKRDKNMTNGWFTYTWKVNPERAVQNYLQMKRKQYAELLKTVTDQSTMYYKCRKGCGKHEFENAMDLQFRCPKCNSNLKYMKNGDELKSTERKIKEMESLLGKQLVKS